MAHEETPVDLKKQEEDKRIAKEMMPFFLLAAIPVLIIVFIALKWGPSY
ncbi:MAG: hypothetical protein ACXWRE_12770 [Pseudobdellovibrionaceae bacterium]